jgi:hypothetical protein
MNNILKYQEQKMLENIEKSIQTIESKICENIDKNPFDEYINLRYDDQFTKEMDKFVINHLTKEGFYVIKYYGDDSTRAIGLSLLTKEQKDRQDSEFKELESRMNMRYDKERNERNSYCNIL